MFGHTKILHTLIGMGSAALAAAVPRPGKATRISRKRQRRRRRRRRKEKKKEEEKEEEEEETPRLSSPREQDMKSDRNGDKYLLDNDG